MKKILLIFIALFTIIFLSSCASSGNSSKYTDITGIEDFKWGMTKDDVKDTVDDYNLTLKKEKKKELIYNTSDKTKKEVTFTFKKGLLDELSISYEGNEGEYQARVEESQELFDKQTIGVNMDDTVLGSYFYTKTTELSVGYTDKSISNDKKSSVCLTYQKYTKEKYGDYDELETAGENEYRYTSSEDETEYDYDDEDSFNDYYDLDEYYDDDELDDDYEEETTKPDVPQEYISALAKANDYANDMHMSKKKVYDQLTSEYGEDFPEKAAKYAMKHVKANWKKNALSKAKDYFYDMHMSRNKVHDQLVSEYGEGFTEKEAQYAMKHLED